MVDRGWQLKASSIVRIHWIRFLVHALVCTLLGFETNQIAATAQDQESESALLSDDEVARIEQLQLLIQQADQSTTLLPDQKSSIKDSYQSAIDNIRRMPSLRKDRSDDEDQASKASLQLALARNEYESTPITSPTDYSQFSDLSEVIRLLDDKNDDLSQANSEAETYESQRAERVGRIEYIKTRLSDLDRLIAQDEQTLAALQNSDVLTEVITADRVESETSIQANRLEKAKLIAEQRLYKAEEELLPQQINLSRRKSVLFAEQVEALTKRSAELRKNDAENQRRIANEFKVEFADVPILQVIATQAEATATKRIEYTDELATIDEELKREQLRMQVLQEDYDRAQNRVKNSVTTTSIGIMLRKQRTALPDVFEMQRGIRSRQNLIREVEIDLYDAKELEDEFSDPDKLAKTLASTTGESESRILVLLNLQRDTSRAYYRELYDYRNRLVDLDTTATRTLESAIEYREFIDQNILWVRSNSPIWELSPNTFSKAWYEIRQLGEFGVVVETLESRIKSRLLGSLTIALVLIVLLWQQGRLREKISKQAEIVRPVTSTRFSPTIHALLLTLLIAITWPLLVFSVGELLREGNHPDVKALGIALQRLATWLIAFEFVRQVCRTDGLALAHFKWPIRVVELVSRTARTAMWLVLPLIFVHEFARNLDHENIRETVERFAFIAIQGGFMVIAYILFRPSHGVMQEHITKFEDGWVSRTRYFWLMVSLGVPSAYVVLSIFGYLYTAEQLFDRVHESISLFLVLLVLSALLSRWVLVGRRRIRMAQMRERLEQSGADVSALPVEIANDVDIVAINAQSKRLIRSGIIVFGMISLYFVWADVLPALNILDSYQVWPLAGETDSDTRTVTVKHILIVIPILIGTWIAFRNAPGLIEIAILQRLPLEQSLRYAITTMVSYVIAVIGVILSGQTLGFDWSSVAYIVAALGVGLGFGLQEIVANFVSGIILLFERPIRVGDVVTVGDVTGVVSQIHIRATKITDWDRKDYIVPNKDLITGRLLNWTLSDSSSRILITVGVGYNSNPQDTARILNEVVTANSNVLAEPAPLITFESFDDSSLRFVVRCYVGTLGERLTTISALHTEIFNRLSEEKIEIAFPQLDVNLFPQRPLETQTKSSHSSINT